MISKIEGHKQSSNEENCEHFRKKYDKNYVFIYLELQYIFDSKLKNCRISGLIDRAPLMIAYISKQHIPK